MSLPRPLRGFVQSWHARGFYAEAGLAARGAGLVYLLVVVLVCQLVAVGILGAGFWHWLDHDAPRYVRQLPTLTIDHGRVSTDAPLPYRMADPKTGVAWAVIDTGATLADVPPAPSVLVTATQVVVRRNAVETRVFQLAGIRHLVIGPDTVLGWLRLLSVIVPPCLYVFLVGFGWLWNLGGMLLLALVGLVVARGREPRLDYAACMRVAAVALTPVIVLDVLLTAAHLRFGLWWLFSLGIAVGYAWWGVRATQAAAAGAGGQPGAPPPPEPLATAPGAETGPSAAGPA